MTVANSIYGQKHLRTGDTVRWNKSSDIKIHYLVEKDGQMSFESPVHSILEVITEISGKKVSIPVKEISL